MCVFYSKAQVTPLSDTLRFDSNEGTENSSILKRNTTTSKRNYLYDIPQSQLRWDQSSINFLLADTMSSSGMLSLTYDQYQRKFKLPTEAYKTTITKLYSEGFTTIGKMKVLGSFGFNKIWEDSLANNLNGFAEDGMPFTFFASKAGKYERQNFNAKAGAGYNLLKGLDVGTLIHYDYYWSTGSVDPRSDIKTFHLSVLPSLSYQWRNTMIGTHLLFGKTDETLNSAYKNSMYSTSQLYPERRLYINNGYGYISQYANMQSAFNNRISKENGWGIDFQTGWRKWRWKAFLQKKKNTMHNETLTYDASKETPITEVIYGTYKTNKTLASSLMTLEEASVTHLWKLEGNDFIGNGYLTKTSSSSNYRYKNRQLGLQYLLSIHPQKQTTNELGIALCYNAIEKNDYTASHLYKHNQLIISTNWAKYWYFNERVLKVKLSPNFTLPTENVLTVPNTQKNVFTQNIAYPEYIARSYQLFGTSIAVQYDTPRLFNFTNGAIMVNIDYMNRLNSKAVQWADYDQPANGKSQIHCNVGIQIYL